MLGGPMYALEKGLGWKWLAVLFALFAALASFGIGSTVQANAISTLVENQYGISPYITGAIVTALGAAVILGGVNSIAKVCGMLVPFMALFYVLGCIYILCVNHAYLLPAIHVILDSAFTTKAAGGGFAGSTMMIAARYGIARGLFSNESGLGSAPIVAAAAQTRNPVRQALVSSTGTFWDTVIICALTGLVITSSIIAYPDIDYHNGAALTKAAFSKIPYIGAPILTIGLATFAFSTTLGWSYYGERCVEYLKGKKWMLCFRIVYIATIFLGSVISLGLVWNIADCMNALMAIPNLISLLCLSGIIVSLRSIFLDELLQEIIHILAVLSHRLFERIVGIVVISHQLALLGTQLGNLGYDREGVEFWVSTIGTVDACHIHLLAQFAVLEIGEDRLLGGLICYDSTISLI